MTLRPYARFLLLAGLALVGAACLKPPEVTPDDDASGDDDDADDDDATNAPPEADIVAPDEESEHTQGQAVEFVASASDDGGAEHLTASWSSDVDGGLHSGAPTAGGLATFTTDALSPGDHVVTLVVTDAAGLQDTDVLRLTVVATNQPPSPPKVVISPPGPQGDDDLFCFAVASVDPEGDEVTYSLSWAVDGVDAEIVGDTVPADATTRDQTWTCSAVARDPEGAESDPGSAQVVIENASPSFTSVSLGPAPASETSLLVCTPEGWSDPDGDPEGARFEWLVGGVAAAPEGPELDGAHFDHFDEVQCRVFPSDGDAEGSPLASNAVTIENTPPSAPPVTLTPDVLRPGDVPECHAGLVGLDPDPDPLAVEYAWEVDGVLQASQTGAALVGIDLAVGQDWTCRARVHDGYDWSGWGEATAEVVPREGDLVVVEVMARPEGVADSDGEWIEVWNPTGRFVNLAGLTLRDGGGGEHTIAPVGGSLSVSPGERIVLARRGDPSANGGVEATYVYAGIDLGDESGSISLSYAGILLDAVSWGDGAGFPDAAGASMSLAPGSDHLDNDLGSSWCDATSLIWQGGDFGTPGQANDDCACAASDGDGDGFGDDGSCALAWFDCDDATPGTHPGGSDACDDGIDQDCSGADLPCDCASTDEDGDGYGTAPACEAVDCDDTDPGIWPGAVEVCDGDDEDCDGVVDGGHDDDGDGVTTCAGDCDDTRASVKPGAAETCNGRDDDCDWLVDEGFDADGDGFTVCGGDCRDTDSGVYYGAPELCNDVDDDCDGHVDEGFDNDGDGFTTCEGDCDDARSAVKPGAPELCNGVDDDCDTGIDEGFDVDGDGWTTCEGDCNDGRAQTWPGAFEGCNGTDDDCDGLVDEGYDGDGDGRTSCAGDCDDADPAIRPGASDTCDDGIDQDCNGADRPCGCDETDFDGDGYGTAELCGDSQDCDDTDAAVHPGAVETCDSADEDCDGVVDEGLDVDHDGYTPCGGDCNDEHAAVNPGRAEVCNLVDDECDGLVDEGFDTDADGWTVCAGDCDDGDSDVNPGMAEVCNGMNDDCDGEFDERNAVGCIDYMTDFDGDGYGVGAPGCFCEVTPPYTTVVGGDCDDGNRDAFPEQREYFDVPRANGSFDYDCNGTAERLWTEMEGCSGDVLCLMDADGWLDAVPGCGVARDYVDSCVFDLFILCRTGSTHLVTQECH